jgi:hypothetical protein
MDFCEYAKLNVSLPNHIVHYVIKPKRVKVEGL